MLPEWVDHRQPVFAIISDSGSIGIVIRHAKGVFDMAHLCCRLEMTTSTTSKRKTISGISSILSHVMAPRRIKRRFFLSTASSGRPKSSDVRVLTSTKTSSFCRLSRQTMSTSPPCGARKFRKRILWPFFCRWRTARFLAGLPERQMCRSRRPEQDGPHALGDLSESHAGRARYRRSTRTACIRMASQPGYLEPGCCGKKMASGT